MSKIEITKTELVWPGKYNEDGTRKEVERVNLPFQVIETINETRATREAAKKPKQQSLFDVWQAKEGDTFEEGWKNKLIWGENLLVMSSLLEKFAGKIDLIYIPSGAIKFYYPDFVAVQKGKNGKQINWIIETKGQVYEAVAHKELSIIDWCKKVSTQTGEIWNYIRVDQKVFGDGKFKKFADLVDVILGKSVTPLFGD